MLHTFLQHSCQVNYNLVPLFLRFDECAENLVPLSFVLVSFPVILGHLLHRFCKHLCKKNLLNYFRHRIYRKMSFNMYDEDNFKDISIISTSMHETCLSARVAKSLREFSSCVLSLRRSARLLKPILNTCFHIL